MTAVKICGVTRAADAACAASLGASYVGCIFAGGPRTRTPEDAAAIFVGVATADGPRRVGVFGTSDPTVVAAGARAARLDVVQMHTPASVDAVGALRRLGYEVWGVARCVGGHLPPEASLLWDVADGVLLDAFVPGRLGGTGTALPWADLAPELTALRDRPGPHPKLVLAGGLTADNVGEAIAALRPDIVDVSSGVESGSPGIKDPARIGAFIDAVRMADRVADRAIGRRSPSPTIR